jgi:putative transcriptional regulator
VSEAGDRILTSIRKTRAVLRGEIEGAYVTVHTPESVDVRAIRERLGMSQAKFAKSFGLELSTVQNWEHGRRHPEGAARVLLRVIEREPEAVQRALTAG